MDFKISVTDRQTLDWKIFLRFAFEDEGKTSIFVNARQMIFPLETLHLFESSYVLKASLSQKI